MSTFCAACKRSFVNRFALEQHQSSPKHANASDNPPPSQAPPLLLQCQPCERVFRDNHALQQHLTSSKHAAHECIPCGRTFVHAKALQQHLVDSPKHKSSPVQEASSCSSPPSHHPSPECEVVQQDHTAPDAIDDFFAEYPSFRYHPNRHFRNEFNRLCRHFRWEEKNDEPDNPRNIAWKKFQIAMIKAFGSRFGSAIDDIHAWGRLCETAGVEPIPDDIEERHQIIIKTHINLVDMLDCRRRGVKAKVFSTVEELREYTIKTGRIFPREQAYASELLMYLLREIFRVYHGLRGHETLAERKERLLKETQES